MTVWQAWYEIGASIRAKVSNPLYVVNANVNVNASVNLRNLLKKALTAQRQYAEQGIQPPCPCN